MHWLCFYEAIASCEDGLAVGPLNATTHPSRTHLARTPNTCPQGHRLARAVAKRAFPRRVQGEATAASRSPHSGATVSSPPAHFGLIGTSQRKQVVCERVSNQKSPSGLDRLVANEFVLHLCCLIKSLVNPCSGPPFSFLSQSCPNPRASDTFSCTKRCLD